MMTTGPLHGIVLSSMPSKRVIGTFLILNVCALTIVLIARRWISPSRKTARLLTPDLEKPTSRPGGRGKVTRKPGGKLLSFQSLPP